MPVLDIRAEELGENRTRLTLSYIESVMLWPNDKAMRTRAYAAARATHLHDAMQYLDDASLLSLKDLSVVMDVLVRAPPLADVHADVMTPFARGTIAGLIFGEAMTTNRIGKPRKLQDIKTDISKRFHGNPGFGKLSSSTIENAIWKPYSPVAHLWAASHRLNGQEAVFPCRLTDLPSFLAIAEYLRREGEAHRPKQAPPLLDAERTWKLPESLPLPNLAIHWGRC